MTSNLVLLMLVTLYNQPSRNHGLPEITLFLLDRGPINILTHPHNDSATQMQE